MTLLSFVFEGALALLMIALIVYCVKLNRGLAAIRASDTQINELIGRLIEASDRAEASVAQLKAVGVARERALRAAIEDAEAMRASLAPSPAGVMDRDHGAAETSLSEGVVDSQESLVGLPALQSEPIDESPALGQDTRSEVEQTLLTAFRQARAAG